MSLRASSSEGEGTKLCVQSVGRFPSRDFTQTQDTSNKRTLRTTATDDWCGQLFHPSIICSAYPFYVCKGGCNPIWHWERGRVHPLLVSSITQGQHTETTIHTHIHIYCPISLTPIYMSLYCGRKLEYLEKTHTDMGRTYKLHTEPGFKLGTGKINSVQQTSSCVPETQKVFSSLTYLNQESPVLAKESTSTYKGRCQ